MTLSAQYMQRALELARKGEGRTCPNPAVGAVLVRGDRIVGEGFHPRAGEPHAEIFALRDAGELARGADLYVTLEPCSHFGRTGPCAQAIVDAGVSRVFVGTADPNPKVCGQGIARMVAAGIEVHEGILEKECRRLIAPFAKHVTTGRPFVILKSAMTLDGKTATRSGDSRWISNEASREDVHRLRDRVDAIMVGVGTVLRDDPRLTTRLPEGGRDPVRIVVDTHLRIPEEARILEVDSAAPTLVATGEQASEAKIARLKDRGAEILLLPLAGESVDLKVLMERLGARGLQSILLEGGSRLNAGALAAGIIDRIMVYVAPRIVGGDDGRGIFSGPGIEKMAGARGLTDVRVRRFGDDILVEGEVAGCLPD